MRFQGTAGTLVALFATSCAVAANPQRPWAAVHALEGIGLRETSHAGCGWDDVVVSAEQEFAAACDTAGRVRIFRVLMYPNLYPRWPLLQYGEALPSAHAFPLPDPGDPVIGTSACLPACGSASSMCVDR